MSAPGTARRAAAALGATALLLLSGCASPAYYTQAISGHLSLMGSREPVEEYLAQLPPDGETARQLRAAQAILAFAEQELDLPAGDSYQTYVPMDGVAITWNVVATPPFELKPKRWCFLVAGCVPYRGYFKQHDADRFAGKLRGKGLDVSVSRATAYSTLGWFDDPILGTMLSGPVADLAEVLIHELAHQSVYVRGATSFNESYATFVAQVGVRAWMLHSGDEDGLARWEAREAATRDFIHLLGATRDELAEVYAGSDDAERLAMEKQRVFAGLETAYQQLVTDRWDGRNWYQGWFEPPPNNADLALVGSYTDGLCAFETLWRESGADFARFHRAVAAKGELDPAARALWLETPCPEPTPGIPFIEPASVL